MTLEETLEENKNAIRRLKEQLASPNKVVPFVGAGIGAGEPYKFKLWKRFLEELGKQYGELCKTSSLLRRNKYEKAAQHLFDSIGEHAFAQAIEDEFGKHRLGAVFEPTPAWKAIIKLTGGAVVTTNYDHLMEETFRHGGWPFERVVYGVGLTATQQVTEQSKHYLLKIHGDAHEKSQRILTRSEYEKAYGRKACVGYDPKNDLPKILRKLMTGTPLLFLGSSMGVDRTMMVLKHITVEMDHGGHFAILEKPKDANELARLSKRLSKMRVTPIWFEAPDYDYSMMEKLLVHLTADLPDRSPAPKPKLLKGQLSGPTDSRLQPNEPFLGRDDDKQAIDEWLQSGTSMATVSPVATIKGAPGIGKSRLCQKVIAEYLETDPRRVAFYISLQSAKGLDGLWARIAEAYEWTDTDVGDFPRRMDEIGGLVYLDNLEDVLDDPKVRSVLQRFAQFQKAKVLSSSREELSLIGKNIPLGRLDKENAKELFVEHWNGVGGPQLTLDAVLQNFIHHQLDCHPLSIKLVASLAGTYPSVNQLMDAWAAVKTQLASTPNPSPSKDESLEVSISLSYDKLCHINPEAIQAWATIAMFPEGMSTLAQERIFPKEWAVPNSPLNLLVHHNLAERQPDSDRIIMLTPIQLFIKQTLDWGKGSSQAILNSIVEFLGNLGIIASKEYLTDQSKYNDSALILRNEVKTLEEVIQRMAANDSSLVPKVRLLIDVVGNEIAFRPFEAISLCNVITARLTAPGNEELVAEAKRIKGKCLSQIGEMQDAKQSLSEAAGLFRITNNPIALANALQALAYVECRLNDRLSANSNFEEAEEIYLDQSNEQGRANVFVSKAECLLRLNKNTASRECFLNALDLYQKQNDLLGIGNCHKGLGDIHFVETELEEGIKEMELAIELFKQIGNGATMTECYLSIAWAYHNLKKLIERDQAFAKANELANQINIPVVSRHLEKLKGEFYAT